MEKLNKSIKMYKSVCVLQIGKRLAENGLTDYATLSWKIQPEGNVFQKSNATQQTDP